MPDLQWDAEMAMKARFEDGRDDGIKAVALNLLQMGMSVNKIQEATNLSVERINELAQSSQSNAE